MKKPIKRLLSAVLTAAIVFTALPSVIGAGAAEDTLNIEAEEIEVITAPAAQPKASKICPPGYYEDGKQHLPTLVIVAGFEHFGYNTDYNWSQTIFGDDKQSIINKDSGVLKNSDTLQKYFRVMSHDKFVLEPVAEKEGANDGVVHVTLDYEHWDTSSDYAKYYEYKAIEDAISTANQFVDISKYDTDGSGIIENNELMVAIIFAGYDAAAKKYSSIDDPKKLSSASYAAFPLKEDDGEGHSKEFFPELSGKKIKPYITCPESRLRKNNSDTQTSFGVFARTSLIFMGLPNYLGKTDAAVRDGVTANEWENYRTNYLSPMGRNAGVYVNSNGTVDENRTAPYSLDPWAKIRLGWATSKTVDVAEGSTITETVNALDYSSIGSQETILRVNVPGKEKEYYLIENRQSRGYDIGFKSDKRYTGCNRDGGIIVWHIDESVMDAYTYDIDKGAQTNYTYLQTLAINDTYHHPAITPVFVEYDNSVQEKRYNFRDNTADFHTCLFTADWLSKYGLSKIDLMKYTGSDVSLYSGMSNLNGYSDRVGDRKFTGISIYVPENSDNMEINITFPTTSPNPNAQPAANNVCAPGTYNYKDGKQHLPVLVIVAGFKDVLPYNPTYNWSKSIFGDDEVSVNDNGVLINGDSVQGYFHTMSHGNLVLDPVKENEGTKDDGVIHVTIDASFRWDADKKGANDKEDEATLEAMRTAMELKDKNENSVVDISQYDTDGSGIIENYEMMPIVLFAGYDLKSKKLTSDTSTDRSLKMSSAWCSSFDVNSGSVPTFTGNGKSVKIPWFITSAENRLINNQEKDIQTSFGAIAHEALHYMGIPDYYAMDNIELRDGIEKYEWRSFKVECLSPMGRPHGVFVYADENGNPVTNTDRTAAYSLDPWAKIRLGWARSKTVEYNETEGGIQQTVNAYDYSDIDTQTETILRVNIPDCPEEYYLIENRQFKGYDKGMKYDPRYIDSNSDGGIVVWHIDESVLDAYTYDTDRKSQSTRTYLQSMVINDSYHHPAIMPVLIENNHSSGGKDWNFLGYSVNFRTAIHSSETLELYGLSKINLTKYSENFGLYSDPTTDTENFYSDRVGDREYTGVSVEPSESKDSMTVTIRKNDSDYPIRMKAIYLEKTADVFPGSQGKDLKAITPYLFAFKNNDDNPYVVKMDPVRDNIYVAYVPNPPSDDNADLYSTFHFNDGEEQNGEYNKHSVRGSEMIYSNGKWSIYQKAVYASNPNPKLSTAKIRGDANLDNKITIRDVTKLQRYLSECQYMSKLELAAADTDINGWINVADITIIQRFLAEYEMKSPVSTGNEITKICL